MELSSSQANAQQQEIIAPAPSAPAPDAAALLAGIASVNPAGSSAPAAAAASQQVMGAQPFWGDALLQAIDNTGICVFMYYPQARLVVVPENTCKRYQCRCIYENMPISFADDFVHDDDRQAFFELYHDIDEGAKTASARFHNKDGSACCHVTLTELRRSSQTSMREVVGIVEDVSESDRDKQLIDLIQSQLDQEKAGTDDELEEAQHMISVAVGSQYYGLYHVWLNTGTFVCYQENVPGVLSTIGSRGEYAPAWIDYVDNYVEPQDRPAMYEFADIEAMAERLKAQNAISCEYRRKGVGWTRGQFIAARRDEEGNVTNAVFTATDINAEKTMELARRRAVYEAQHDQLTGALNRKAFDEALASGEFDGMPVGFAIMDIDRFKDINDEFGHEAGDDVIAVVSKAISTSFRDHDRVFRIGGDEFVVLFPDADASSWRAICKKLERLHVDLAENISQDIKVTLSVGMCFSPSGIEDWMYRVADDALYNTKRNGCAGCTLMDERGNVVDYWHDEDASEKTIGVLIGSRAGIARIERSVDGSHPSRFIGGDAVRIVYGMPHDATPEECYNLWANGISPVHRRVLDEAAQKMLSADNVECTFSWSCEGRKPFLVRMVGTGKMEGSTAVLYGLHRSLEDAVIVESDDAQRILDAQNAVYDSACYIDLTNMSFSILKDSSGFRGYETSGKGAARGILEFVSSIVHPDYREKALAFFDLDTLADRLHGETSIDCEYPTLTEKGWCRASWLPVRRNSAGTVTHALLLVSAIDAMKQREMEKARENARLMALHYEAAETLLNTKIIAMALLDKATRCGRMWTRATDFSRPEKAVMSELVKLDAALVPEPERAAFLAALDPDGIVAHVEAADRYTVPTTTVLPNGSTRYAEYHFTEYGKDKDMMLAVVEDVTAIHEGEGRSVEDLFNNVPGGLITYEWDGERLKVLHVSSYCNKIHGSDMTGLVGSYVDSGYETVHPDDRQALGEAIEEGLKVTQQLHYNYRKWSCEREEYRWMHIDAVTNVLSDVTTLVYALFTDVTDQKNAEEALGKAFEERMDSLLDLSEGSMRIGVFDLTDGVVGKYRKDGASFPVIPRSSSYDEALTESAKLIHGEADREKFTELFSRDNLKVLIGQGRKKASMECMLETEPGKTEWCEIALEMATDPVSGHVEAIAYTHSVNDLRMANLLVKQGMSSAYSMVAVLVHGGDEFFLYDRAMGVSCQHRRDFWATFNQLLDFLCTPEESSRVKAIIDRDSIYAALDRGENPSIPMTVQMNGMSRLFSLVFHMMDAERGLVASALRDVTDEETSARLLYAARHDSLTGLYRRQAYFDECRNLLERHPDEDFAILKLNVRRFRLFNASFGEKAGDRLLKAIADGIRKVAREYDAVAYGRIEADVFSLFFPTSCRQKTEEHIGLIGKMFEKYCDDFLLEPSVGVYEVVDRTMPIESMFARATTAAQVGAGRDGYVGFYTDEMERRFEDEMFIANEMRSAFDKDQFAVYLQPKYNLATGEFSGAEALVRWVHPERGLIPPGKFIPVFESNGFVSRLDHVVWESVCRLLRRWIDEGRDVKPVSVNVSRVSAYSKATAPYLKDLVERYGIDPSLLELELTESAYIDDPEDIKRSLGELQEYGFRILMDDFGSGYSSLNTLRELPVDCLKLDMRFLSDACDDPRGRTVLSSMVEMTKRLHLPVIAEGVETERQAEFLKSTGCEYVQGYLFAKPMPVEEYERLG